MFALTHGCLKAIVFDYRIARVASGCIAYRQPSIRDGLGIRKKMEVSAETLERLRSIFFKSNPRPEAGIRSNIGVGRLPRYPYGPRS
jgi:hypothetical protein